MRSIDWVAIVTIVMLAVVFLVTREGIALGGLMSVVTFYFGRESAKAEVPIVRRRKAAPKD